MEELKQNCRNCGDRACRVVQLKSMTLEDAEKVGCASHKKEVSMRDQLVGRNTGLTKWWRDERASALQ
jgi:ArsR family metal-binding transcriptional regulator